MSAWLDWLLVLIALSNFVALAAGRVWLCIRAVAGQGVCLGLLPLVGALAGHEALSVWVVVLAMATIIVKGFVFPLLLRRTMRKVNVRREGRPVIGYSLSLVVGVGALGLAFWLAQRLPLPAHVHSSLIVPVALFTMFAGLFLIISRRLAITQVVGYLVAENGIYAFGHGLVRGGPVLVELGVLLDLLVAVLVMGLAIYHIHDVFESTETDRISDLRG